MDVYQSSKTAAELEFALGAVPSIGENGNWFVGDQDTGVFAGGVDVTGAEVGQIIQVSEIDENGRPTAWEACHPKSGIKKIRLIADITLDQENLPEYIELTTDMDGNPFSMREFVIMDDFTTGVNYKTYGCNVDGGVHRGVQTTNGTTCVHFYAGDNYIEAVHIVPDTRVAGPNLGGPLIAFCADKPNDAYCAALKGPVTSIFHPTGYRITKGTYMKVYEVYE